MNLKSITDLQTIFNHNVKIIAFSHIFYFTPCISQVHTRLARTLIKCFPKLALDVVEGEEYLGASALHLAIAYNNNELVQDLVEAGANVNQRAIGSFFLPRDQQKPKPAKCTDYEGLAYLGEYPLAWAACCANESVYNLLLDNGANPDFQDNFGNMILHMVVVCDKLVSCLSNLSLIYLNTTLGYVWLCITTSKITCEQRSCEQSRTYPTYVSM